MRFRFQGLEGFHPDVKTALAENPAVLAGFVLAEINYKANELDEPLKLNQHDDDDVKDYLAWLSANGAPGDFPLQIMLADTPERRMDWAKRHVDPESVAQTITDMPDALLTEHHPMIEVWSPSRQAGVLVEEVVMFDDDVCSHGDPHRCRMYPFVQRLTVEEVVVVNALLMAISASFGIERGGFGYYDGKPPADILTLTRMLFDRGADLEVAYLPDRLEVFHKAPTAWPEKVSKGYVAQFIPTAQKPNPFPAGLLPDGSPTAFDLPQGANLDRATGVLSLLSKLASGSSDPTMDEALAFEQAVNAMVGTPKTEA